MSNPAVLEPDAGPETPARHTAEPLRDVVLARLLPATKSVGLREIAAAVGPLFRRPPAAERVAAVVAELKGEGLLLPGQGNRLSEAGRARALAYLGTAELPPRASWGTVKADYLVPKALGLSADEMKRYGDARRLVPLLLKRKLGLPVGTGPSLGAVLEALACRELGFPDHATFKSLLPTLLGRAVGADGPVAVEDAAHLVPQVLLGATTGGVAELRRAVLSGWLDGGPAPAGPAPEAVPDEVFDLEAFANTVRAVARTCPTGRVGDNKVFISHVWRDLREEPRFARLGADGFKAELAEANRRRLLTLSRADLVQFLDPADVRESETPYLTSVFHLILVEGE